MSGADFRREDPSFGQKFAAWRNQHLRSMVVSTAQLIKKPFSSLMTLGVMAIAIALPLGLLVILFNVQSFSGHVQNAREISAFLRSDVSLQQAQNLADELRQRADVQQVQLRNPDDGLDIMRKQQGWGDAIAALDGNPLPSVLIITPKDEGASVIESLKTNQQIDVLQHDSLWRARLNAWLQFGQRFVWVLSALLVLGMLLAVSNTIRLDIGSRRDEISVLQELGATDAFIRRPFLYQGWWLGVIAGSAAIALLSLALWYLQIPLNELLSSYSSGFRLRSLNLVQAIGVVLASGLLGIFGAWLASGHHLRQTRP